MRRARSWILAISVTVALPMMTSCEGGQSPLALFTRPTSVDPHALQRISIVGNVIFNTIGQTGQFTATATFNDGTSKNVTPNGQWQSSDTHVATVSETGEARIVGFGTCVISFEYEKQHASVNVRASPPDTFTLRGRLREPGGGEFGGGFGGPPRTGGGGLAGVVVLETSSGRSAVTSANGQFAMSDVPRRQLRLKVKRTATKHETSKSTGQKSRTTSTCRCSGSCASPLARLSNPRTWHRTTFPTSSVKTCVSAVLFVSPFRAPEQLACA
jgi:hypothetical protein